MFDKKHEHSKDDYSEPFRVVILEDCRLSEDYGPNGNLTGQRGTCLGEYIMPEDPKGPDLSKKATQEQQAASIEALLDGDESDEIELANPLILSDSGDYIWGLHCYFSREEDLKDVPEGLWSKIPERVRELLRGHLN